MLRFRPLLHQRRPLAQATKPLRREVAGDIQDQVSGTVGEGIDRAILGGHD